MDSSRRIVAPDEDPLRNYTPEEQRQLTENLLELTTAIHAGKFSHLPVDQRLLEVFHSNIFRGVRGHAGRTRAPGRGSERVTFGPHRSSHRDDVGRDLATLFARAAEHIRNLEAHSDTADFDAAALQFAVLLHADIIRVHPFEDGNGRSTRALMNATLVKLGLLPVPIDAPKQEYIDALNVYFKERDPAVLVDLIVGLYGQ